MPQLIILGKSQSSWNLKGNYWTAQTPTHKKGRNRPGAFRTLQQCMLCCLAHPHLNELTHHPKAWRGTKKYRYFL